MTVDPKDYAVGDRVRAVGFWLDGGTRIWPMQSPNLWRVVRVIGGPDPDDFIELFRGEQIECQRKYPSAVYGINDNETVPPGTEGTVDSVSSTQVGVTWDNGRRLFCAPKDTIEKL